MLIERTVELHRKDQTFGQALFGSKTQIQSAFEFRLLRQKPQKVRFRLLRQKNELFRDDFFKNRRFDAVFIENRKFNEKIAKTNENKIF